MSRVRRARLSACFLLQGTSTASNALRARLLHRPRRKRPVQLRLLRPGRWERGTGADLSRHGRTPRYWPLLTCGIWVSPVTPGTGDRGLDAVAEGAAAQVKHHAAPTGSPDIQRLFGAAAGFPNRLFYATAYTPAGIAEGERLKIALFQFTFEGLVTPINGVARQVAPSGPAPEERGLFGTLTFESRQNRAIRWAQQIEEATKVPISDRQRKGSRQLAQRQQALQLMLQGLDELKDSDNRLYKQRRKERTLDQAEKTLKSAGRLLGLLLR